MKGQWQLIAEAISSSDIATKQDDENEDKQVSWTIKIIEEYQKMDLNLKGALTTKKVVDDELYQFGMKFHHEQ
jgi:hypothetical protein